MPAAIALIALFASVVVVWPQYGWPYWPVLMGVAAALTFWGTFVNSWRAPLIVLCGYLGMRGVIWGLDRDVWEIGAFTVWAVGAIMLYRTKAWIPGTAYLCSGVVYPFFLLFDVRIAYHGLAPIVAELFALFALISMGGGLYERTRMGSDRSARGGVGRFGTIWSNVSLGVASDNQSPQGRMA